MNELTIVRESLRSKQGHGVCGGPGILACHGLEEQEQFSVRPLPLSKIVRELVSIQRRGRIRIWDGLAMETECMLLCTTQASAHDTTWAASPNFLKFPCSDSMNFYVNSTVIRYPHRLHG